MTDRDPAKQQPWQRRQPTPGTYRTARPSRGEKVAAGFRGEDERMEALARLKAEDPAAFRKLDSTLRIALGTYLGAKQAHEEMEAQS